MALTIAMSAGTFSFYNHVNAEVVKSDLDYAIISEPANLKFAPNEKRVVSFLIQNVSGATWDTANIGLVTTYSDGAQGRPSIWKGEGWTTNQLIRPTETGAILAGKKMSFNFELAAPAYSGLFKEHFALTIDTAGSLRGEAIILDIQVGDAVRVQASEAKEIHIYRTTQLSNLMENGYIVATLPISSGKPGYTTPAGAYTVMNKHPEAYSSKYQLYMSNWMALSSKERGYEGYGLHSLAYWKTSKPIYPSGTIRNGRLYVGNRVYEDAIHLGKPMSHGCVRYGIEESAMLFDWAEVGTKVQVI